MLVKLFSRMVITCRFHCSLCNILICVVLEVLSTKLSEEQKLMYPICVSVVFIEVSAR